MNRRLYAAHRWLSLLALAQLAVWTATGLFFAVAPIERVRGTDRAAAPAREAIAWDRVGALPVAALAGAEEVTVRMQGSRPVLLVSEGGARRRLDAGTGAPWDVTAEDAALAARAAERGAPAVRGVERIETAPLEYRGGAVPAFRVDLEDGRGTRVYVDATTGAVVTRRNDLWRVYDFLWGLHVMDYRGRDDFNHPLLVAFASLGVVTVASGAVLWGLRLGRRAGRQRAGGAPTV